MLRIPWAECSACNYTCYWCSNLTALYYRLMDTLSIRSFGIEEMETGNSWRLLLHTFRISRLIRLAIPAGNSYRRLWLSVSRVTKVMDTGRRRVTLDQEEEYPTRWDFTIMTSAHKLPYMAINRNSLKLGHSSIAPMFWSTRSISLHWPAFASARIFFTLDIFELVTGEKQLADGACMIAIVTLLSIRKKTKISEMSHVRQWSAVHRPVLILI